VRWSWSAWSSLCTGPHLIYYLEGPHLIDVGLAELLILAAAAALVAPAAARAQTALPAPPPRRQLG